MEVDKIFDKYENENSDLIEYIQKVIEEKQKAGDWDTGIKGQSDKLISVLMYEYASSIEKLTDGKYQAKQVIDKLHDQMGKFRIGDFKLGDDDDITYDDESVTSDEYKKNCRIDKKFGAHAIVYEDAQGESKTAVVLFDNAQVDTIDGEQVTLSGINLQDLSDIRHTVFHEWTHIMERCMIKASQLSKDDIIFTNGKSTYINSMLSPKLSRQEFDKYISSVDDLLASDVEILFGGISTIELKKHKEKRIMHNQISEGATEYIARLVMETVGDKVKHPERYADKVQIIESIFTKNGLSEMLTTYFTEPHKIIKSLESKRVKNKDMLHYISEYVDSSRTSKLFNKFIIDEDGNIQKTGIISRLTDRFKRRGSRKDTILLTDGSSDSIADTLKEKRNEYLESLSVSPEELAKNEKNQQRENVQIREGKEDGPSLDD